jgi:hypothetical protein
MASARAMLMLSYRQKFLTGICALWRSIYQTQIVFDPFTHLATFKCPLKMVHRQLNIL